MNATTIKQHFMNASTIKTTHHECFNNTNNASWMIQQ
jgi:hypothetical protein